MARNNKRDPNAPKRNLSAYLLYQNAMRDHFKAQNPGMTFGELAKYTSAMYAEMTPSEKEAWNARAESDKARYLHELSSYVPPPGYDAKGDIIQNTANMPYGSVASGHTGKRRKAEKDPNAPKRNVSAYLLYQNGMRSQFKSENPDMTFGQLAKYTSHMYKNLTVDEKATWDARAQQDKARYDEQISRYVPPPGHDARGNLITARTGGKRSKRGPKDPAAPKRARGSFVFFTFEMRPIIMKENPNVEFVQMGTILGERWRALTPEQKKRFEDMSAQDKIRFQMEMEKYKVTLQQQQNIAHANAQQQAQIVQAQLQQQQMNALNPMSHQQIAQQHPYYTDPSQQIQHQQPVQVDPNQQQYVDPNQQQQYEQQQLQQQQYEQQQLQQQQHEQQQLQQQQLQQHDQQQLQHQQLDQQQLQHQQHEQQQLQQQQLDQQQLQQQQLDQQQLQQQQLDQQQLQHQQLEQQQLQHQQHDQQQLQHPQHDQQQQTYEQQVQQQQYEQQQYQQQYEQQVQQQQQYHAA